jgi:hypothetical protein
METTQAELRQFAAGLNEMATATLKQDGEHAAMFFMRSESGEVEPRLFESDDQRGADLALAVSSADAAAVGIVDEAWAASESEIPEGGRASDAASRREILLVAALDREGNQAAFETTVIRRRSRQPVLEETLERGSGFRVATFDETRELWGLPRRLHYSGSFGSLDLEVPPRWKSDLINGVVEIVPETDDGAMHISIQGRDRSRPVESGEARRIVAGFARPMTDDEVAVDEREAPWGLVASSTFDVQEATQTRHLDLFAAVANSCVVACTWNDDGSSEQTRLSARAIFETIRLRPIDHP